MIDGKRVLGWIPARGGSKGIKDKNIYPINGKPMIAYTIEAAAKSCYIDRVMVSTDSEKIADVARLYGAWVPELRPRELAADTSKTIDAVLHTLDYLKSAGQTYEIFCLLQPTSPLRTEEDIDGALEVFIRAEGQYGVASVSPAEDHPVLLRSIALSGILTPLLSVESTVRRQDMPAYYKINGSIYINSGDKIDVNTSFNDNPLPYVMEKSHSVDVDDKEDLEMVEYYLGNFIKRRG